MHWFDKNAVRGAKMTWEHNASHLSPLDRAKLIAEAKELTAFLLGAYHGATGWCGDMEADNFKAAWPLVANALADRKRANEAKRSAA